MSRVEAGEALAQRRVAADERSQARCLRLAAEPSVRQKNRRKLGHDHRETNPLWRRVKLPCPGASTSGAGGS